MIDLVASGRVRSIGVSNFKPDHLATLINETGVVPAVNQVQLYPAATQASIRAFDERHNIVTQSWGPLGRAPYAKWRAGVGPFLDHPTIAEISGETGRTPAQVVLRWHLQLGCVPLPKTSKVNRLRENLDVFSFALSDDQMTRLTAIDDGSAPFVDSDLHEEL
jgi:2,5-diketo-D-gluconate reductase A